MTTEEPNLPDMGGLDVQRSGLLRFFLITKRFDSKIHCSTNGAKPVASQR
jgi:hypothetical protein